MAKARLLES